MVILFEPWNLGDALSAASVARLDPSSFILACNSAWHEVLLQASDGSLNLLPLDLPYVWRTGKRFFSLGDAARLKSHFSASELRQLEVVSIRGDLRDWFAARRLFPGAVFNFSGWRPFMARKLDLFDRPFTSGAFPVRNRYRAWADAAGIPFSRIEHSYPLNTVSAPDAPVLIHVGAQWRSKQYPHVAELTELLKIAGRRVEILAGPTDTIPSGVAVENIQRPVWSKLAAQMKGAHIVIANDSGPMHLAAFLGCRVIALSRCSNIAEWLPPGVIALSSPSAPRGYRPVKDYWSDRVLPDWPAPEQVLACLKI